MWCVDRDHDRRILCNICGNGIRIGNIPRLCQKRGAHVACYSKPPSRAQAATDGYEALAVKPVPLDHANCPDKSLIDLSVAAWDNALALGEKHGYRNAQVS